MYELNFHLKNIQHKHKESWEQTRFMGYITAQVNSTKQLKIKDIMSFPWDVNDVNDGNKNTTISNEDVARLKEKAKLYTQTHGK